MSVIPVAIDALLAQLQAAPALRGIKVYDGDESVTPGRGMFLIIGLDAEDQYPADGTSAIGGLAGARRRDVATITCLAVAAQGGQVMKRVRDEADRLYDLARAAIEADPRLGGAVTFAEVASYTYRPMRSDQGVAAQLEFRVQVTAIR